MRLPATLLAVSFLACAPSDEPDEAAPSGFYELEVETVMDDCAPARSIQGGSGLPIASSTRELLVPYPAGPADSAPVAWSRAAVLRRPAAPITYQDLDCPGATSTLAIEITDETATSLEVALVETWTVVAGCAAPGRPTASCRSERVLRFDLEEACEAPCALVLNDCGGAGCTTDDPAWRCVCGEPLM